MAVDDQREARWINPPTQWSVDDNELRVETDPNTDFWRHTAYGFVHHSGHALVKEFVPDSSVEITIAADYSHQFDQAGIMVWADETNWVKCGLEYADGVLGVGAVVTREYSDWSTAPVPEWLGHAVTMRVSRTTESLTIRAKTAHTPWRLVRVAPLDASREWNAGPYAASPTRAGLTVTFSDTTWGPADADLH